MGINSFILLKKQETRHSEYELENDFMNCRDISWIEQVQPFIEDYSKEGELVFDPFCGMGTTVIAAGMVGRKSVGIELEQDRFELLKNHVETYRTQFKYSPELINGDSLITEYPTNVDLVVTNFPYFNGQITSVESDNLYGVTKYDTYLEFIEKVIIRCKQSLKSRGTMIVFCENIRNVDGSMIPQAYDICKIMQKHFILKDERIILYEKDYFSEMDISKTNRAHEYVFICKKRDETYDLSEYKAVVKKIQKEAECVLFGSLGLYLTFPQIMDTFPADADLFAKGNVENIRKIVNILKAEGYRLYSWQDEIGDDFDYKIMKGRYYFRGIKDTIERKYVVDVTYEIDTIDYEELKEQIVIKEGIKVFDRDCYMRLLQISEKLHNQIERLRLQEWKE